MAHQLRQTKLARTSFANVFITEHKLQSRIRRSAYRHKLEEDEETVQELREDTGDARKKLDEVQKKLAGKQKKQKPAAATSADPARSDLERKLEDQKRLYQSAMKQERRLRKELDERIKADGVVAENLKEVYLQKHNQQTRAHQAALTEKDERLRRQLEESDMAHMDAMSEVTAAHKAALAHLEKQLDDEKADRDSDVEHLEQRLGDRDEAYKAALQNAIELKDQLCEETRQHQLALDGRQQDCDELREKLQSQKMKHKAEVAKQKQALEALQQDCDELGEKLQSQEMEYKAKVAKQKQAFDALQQERDRLNRRSQAQEAERNALTKQKQALESQRVELQQQHDESLRTLQGEVDQLKPKLVEEQQARALTSTKNAELQREFEAEIQKNEETGYTLGQAQQDRRLMTATFALMGRELAEARRVSKDLKSKLEREKQGHSLALTRIIVLDLELTMERDVIENGREVIEQLRGKLTQEEQDCGLALTRIDDLGLELTREREVIKKGREELTDEQGVTKALQLQLDQGQQDYGSALTRISTLEREVAEEREVLGKEREVLKKVRDELAKEQGVLKDFQQQSDQENQDYGLALIRIGDLEREVAKEREGLGKEQEMLKKVRDELTKEQDVSNDLQRRLDREKQDHGLALIRIGNLEREAVKEQEVLKNERGVLKKVREEVQKEQEHSRGLQRQLDQEKQDHGNALTKNNELAREAVKEQEVLKKERGVLEKVREELQKEQERSRSLQRQLDQEKQDHRNALTKNDELTHNLTAERGAHRNLKLKSSEERRAKELALTRIGHLERDLTEERGMHTGSKRELSEEQHAIELALTEIQGLKKSAGETQEALNVVQNRFEELERKSREEQQASRLALTRNQHLEQELSEGQPAYIATSVYCILLVKHLRQSVDRAKAVIALQQANLRTVKSALALEKRESITLRFEKSRLTATKAVEAITLQTIQKAKDVAEAAVERLTNELRTALAEKALAESDAYWLQNAIRRAELQAETLDRTLGEVTAYATQVAGEANEATVARRGYVREVRDLKNELQTALTAKNAAITAKGEAEDRAQRVTTDLEAVTAARDEALADVQEHDALVRRVAEVARSNRELLKEREGQLKLAISTLRMTIEKYTKSEAAWKAAVEHVSADAAERYCRLGALFLLTLHYSAIARG